MPDEGELALVMLAAALAEQEYLLSGNLSGEFECPKCQEEFCQYVTLSHKHTYTVRCPKKGCLNFHADGKHRSRIEDDKLRDELRREVDEADTGH